MRTTFGVDATHNCCYILRKQENLSNKLPVGYGTFIKPLRVRHCTSYALTDASLRMLQNTVFDLVMTKAFGQAEVTASNLVKSK
jgi:hypothetical protein